MSRINELISYYPEEKRKSALLPVLHEVQDAHENWLSIELMDKVAEILYIKPIEVYEVVSFLHDVQPETYWEIHVRILSNLTLLFWCRRFDGLYL
jgi:NADH:ubiquinone oxidoreductase subunit E